MKEMHAHARRMALPLSLLLMAVLPLAVHAAAGKLPLVDVKRDGTVEVTIEAALSPGLNAFPAPAPPIPSTIAATVNGTAVPVVYQNGTIYVAVDKPGEARITYLVNVTTRDGYVSFRIGAQRVVLRLEPGVVLLSLPSRILDVRQLPGGSLEAVIEGPAEIRYTVAVQRPQATATKPATSTTPAATTAPAAPSTTTKSKTETGTARPTTTAPRTTPPPATTSKPATQTKPAATGATSSASPAAQSPASPARQSTSSSTQRSSGGSTVPVAAAVAGAVAAVAVGLLLRGRRGQASLGPGGGGGPGGAEAVELRPRGLDDIDRLIIEKLREHGGSMLQSQLLRETGLPKTTLWRHVQKLERMGVIEVVREGRSNRLILREGAPGPM